MKKPRYSKLLRYIRREEACEEATEWVAAQVAAGLSDKEVWDTCSRGNWLCWLIKTLRRRLYAVPDCERSPKQRREADRIRSLRDSIWTTVEHTPQRGRVLARIRKAYPWAGLRRQITAALRK